MIADFVTRWKQASRRGEKRMLENKLHAHLYHSYHHYSQLQVLFCPNIKFESPFPSERIKKNLPLYKNDMMETNPHSLTDSRPGSLAPGVITPHPASPPPQHSHFCNFCIPKTLPNNAASFTPSQLPTVLAIPRCRGKVCWITVRWRGSRRRGGIVPRGE